MGTKNEEEWFRKFYEGTFLVRGWRSRMEELLEAIPPARRAEMGVLLAGLGEKIGREWARDNSIRRVDTALLQEWGRGLSDARKKGPDALDRAIRDLDAQVDRLLA